jgi:hypothetical protein
LHLNAPILPTIRYSCLLTIKPALAAVVLPALLRSFLTGADSREYARVGYGSQAGTDQGLCEALEVT